jgi:mannose-1-phosphate guanylyltransferase
MKTKDFFSGTLDPNNDVVVVTMAGGSGTRFWPMSRTSRPKQFLPLTRNGNSLIGESIERLEPLVGAHASMVVTALSQVDLVKEAVPSVAILAEPLPRNTAACLALSAYYLRSTVGDIPMICTPADHLVSGDDALRGVFKKACALAVREDVLITIGIKPTSPETGYGYIRSGAPFQESDGKPSGAFSVAQFVEKPDSATALRYVESGEFYWNSGMFVWRPSVLITALESLLPETARTTRMCAEMIIDGKSDAEELSKAYGELQSVSIDFGVMEDAKNVVVFPGHNFEWSDIGSWSSWYESAIEDNNDGFQNIATSDVVLVGSEGCAVLSAKEMGIDSDKKDKEGHKKRIIAAVGLEDIIIVDTDDCLLVCKKSESQRVRQVVDILKKRKEDSFL